MYTEKLNNCNKFFADASKTLNQTDFDALYNIVTDYYTDRICNQYNIDYKKLTSYFVGTTEHANKIKNLKTNDIVFVTTDYSYIVTDDNKLLNLYDDKTVVDKSYLNSFDFLAN